VVKWLVPLERPTNQALLTPKPAISSFLSPLKSPTNTWLHDAPMDHCAQAAPVANVSTPLDRPTNQAPLLPMPATSFLSQPDWLQTTTTSICFVEAFLLAGDPKRPFLERPLWVLTPSLCPLPVRLGRELQKREGKSSFFFDFCPRLRVKTGGESPVPSRIGPRPLRPPPQSSALVPRLCRPGAPPRRSSLTALPPFLSGFRPPSAENASGESELVPRN
jgi:hypothetical protein